MYKLSLLFLLITFGAISYSLAQGTATGCLLPNNSVYGNDFMGNATYYETSAPVTTLSNNYCYWTPSSTGVSCNVCTSYTYVWPWGYFPAGCTTGVKGTFSMVACPIDDHTIILTVFTGFIALGIIRRKNTGMNIV